MNYIVEAGNRSGAVSIPSSKSYLHRHLICSFLSKDKNTLICDGISKDITATINCLNALGAKIEISKNNKIYIDPIANIQNDKKDLYCGESGSTLRFLLPIVGALGVSAEFHLEGKLPSRPLDELINTLTEHGMKISKNGDKVEVSGCLKAGNFQVPGNVSSQYISGLLFALPLLDEDSTLEVDGKIESADYIKMTEEVILNSGIKFNKNEHNYEIFGNQRYISKKETTVEQDWSNAAFFLCMGALSEKGIAIKDLPLNSKQGDKEIINILKKFGAKIDVFGNSVTVCKDKLVGHVIDASEIPDLVPTISAVAAVASGTTKIINAERLRYKESDRIASTAKMLKSLGADIRETQDGLIINGKSQLKGGEADAENDHRIAMAAAVAAGACKENVTVIGAECTQKSYPDFWKTLETLEVLR